jgi:hypothetical protein
MTAINAVQQQHAFQWRQLFPSSPSFTSLETSCIPEKYAFYSQADLGGCATSALAARRLLRISGIWTPASLNRKHPKALVQSK